MSEYTEGDVLHIAFEAEVVGVNGPETIIRLENGIRIGVHLDAYQFIVQDVQPVLPPVEPEPGVGSVVLDNDGDAWVRTESGDWTCPVSFGLADCDWASLNGAFGPIDLIHEGYDPGYPE